MGRICFQPLRAQTQARNSRRVLGQLGRRLLVGLGTRDPGECGAREKMVGTKGVVDGGLSLGSCSDARTNKAESSSLTHDSSKSKYS